MSSTSSTPRTSTPASSVGAAAASQPSGGNGELATAATLPRTYETVAMSDVQVRSREVEHDGETAEEDFVVILEQEGSTFKSKEIRKMCKLLGVSGYKNCSKAVMLDLIAQKKVNDAAYTTIFEQKKLARSDPSRKQPQCPFRLLNIVFSDEFASRLDALGERRTRAELDASVSPEKRFWQDVQRAFVSTSVGTYGVLAFTDKHAAFRTATLDPSIIVPHSWESLKTMWMKLLADYESPSTKFAASGTHCPDFFKFCNGRIDLLYLHLFLVERPGLTASVVRRLPPAVFYDSADPPSSSTESTPPPPKRQRSEIADAIRSLVDQRGRADSSTEQNRAMHVWCGICDRLRGLYEQQDTATIPLIVAQLDSEIKILEAKRDELASQL